MRETSGAECTVPTDLELVAALLSANGVTPVPDDLDHLVGAYAPSRRMVAALHAMPGARYAEPALTFDPRG